MLNAKLKGLGGRVMSRVTAINKIIEFQRNLYFRAYYPDSDLSIDEVLEMLDDIQKELENE